MEYTGPERRRFPRVERRFIISYQAIEKADSLARSQTRNISLAGLLFTAECHFPQGTKLALELRLPISIEPIEISGSVVESREIVPNQIYDTHLSFLNIDTKDEEIIKRTVNFFLKKKKR